MRRLLQLLGQLIAAAFVILIFTVIWIIFDGVTDLGERADVALVFSDSSGGKKGTEERLKHVSDLHKDGDFTAVIVSSPATKGGNYSAAEMSKYLDALGIPARTITQEDWDENGPETPEKVAAALKDHNFNSVMLITNYYYVTRTKLEYSHAGVVNIQKAHVGTLKKEDGWKIANEVIALYTFIGKTYLMPAAEKVKEEAKVGVEKAQEDASAAKKNVDSSLNNLPK